ncbi:MAG: hypothetical protein GAK34_02827 [Delftia tsuruhatensis]|nr:MAG: hypothetical protein GAK34_02827 [Delftia tsuruhatensis]
MAFCAMDLPVASPSPTLFMATNHWSVSMGSITWPVRVQMGTMSLCFLVSTSRPAASRSATMALRATKRSMPRYFSGASSLMVAVSVSTQIIGRPWRWPTA